jgi:hypothetical protein
MFAIVAHVTPISKFECLCVMAIRYDGGDLEEIEASMMEVCIVAIY